MRRAVLPVGRATLDWLEEGGVPARGGRRSRFLYRWQSFWFEQNLKLQGRLGDFALPEADPIFIIGPWRSGTTHLHNLMSTLPGMISPSTWQCMQPATMQLRRTPVLPRSSLRPMDGHSISSLSPQEDEFALLALGVPSVYRGFLDPRRLGELLHWLRLDSWTLEEPKNWISIWRRFLALMADNRPGRLLLKSPNHSFRIRPIVKTFPNPTFIWIVRRPEDVFLSNRKMWQAMFSLYSLWDWELPALDAFLLHSLRHAAECITELGQSLPRDRLLVIDFEQLQRAPLQTLETVNSRLRLGNWTPMEAQVRQASETISSYSSAKYSIENLPRGAVEVCRELASVQNLVLNSHGL